eukprot:scaffold602_cov298-Pinguiococcus_pyrenoidosus.AAC.8
MTNVSIRKKGATMGAGAKLLDLLFSEGTSGHQLTPPGKAWNAMLASSLDGLDGSLRSLVFALMLVRASVLPGASPSGTPSSDFHTTSHSQSVHDMLLCRLARSSLAWPCLLPAVMTGCGADALMETLMLLASLSLLPNDLRERQPSRQAP